MSMCNSTAQARTKWSWWNPLSGLVEILVTSCLVQVLTTRSCADPAEIRWNPLKGPCLHGLAQILMRSSCEDPAEILQEVLVVLHRSLCEDLVQILVKSCLRGLCVILNRSLWKDLAEILVKSSLRGPCMILYRPLWEDLVEILVNLWEDLVTIVLKSSKRSLHDLVPVLVRRCCGDPVQIVQILPKRSWHYDFEGALHQKCLYGSSSGMLLGSSCNMKVW